VAIEDTEPGVAAATAAGIRCLAVPTAMSRHHDFSRAEAVLDGMADAVACVLRLHRHEQHQ
jgi:beta-phosphoglucomutase-like phosphatase (HAD superfamily)